MSESIIIDHKSFIHRLLKVRADLRDNDRRLIAIIWWQELKDKKKLEMKNITGQRLMEEFMEGTLTSPETIRRTRQKIQQDHPETRGRNWQIRKEKQKAIRAEMRNNSK